MEKIKRIITYSLESEEGKDILIVIIVILVGLGSFELGRLSKSGSNAGIKILSAQAGEYPDQNSTQEANIISSVTSPKKIPITANSTSTGKTFFASNRGEKYYSIGCSGGKTIKQENRVYFATREEAEKAGYTLSSLCR